MAERIDFPKSELERLYLVEGLSSTQIAKMFNCHPLTIRARMRDYKISLRPRGWQKLKRYVPDEILHRWPYPELAYIIGLIASDGTLEKDNNCIILNTTDYELADIFRKLIGLPNHHMTIVQRTPPLKTSYMVQVCDFVFRAFIEKCGLTPKKALTIAQLEIPDEFFADFLRGEIDGDGSWHVANGWRNVKYLRCKITSKSSSYLVLRQ